MKKKYKFGWLGGSIKLSISISNDAPKEKHKPKKTIVTTTKWEEKLKKLH